MNEIIIGLIGIVSTGASGYFTFLFARRKYNAESKAAEAAAKTVEIENEIKLSNHYLVMLDDLKPRYEIMYKEFEHAMNRKIVLLEEEIKMRDRKIKLLQAEITELKRENRSLKANASNSTK